VVQNIVIRWVEIWNVCWRRKKLKFQFSNCFSGCCCYVKFSVVMMQNNSICQHFSVFTMSSRFQLLFKHSTIPCTIDHLSTILVVLKAGPIKVPKQCKHCFAGRMHTFEYLGPGQWCVSTSCFDICLQVHSGAPMFYHLWQSIAGKPLLLHNITVKMSHIPMCACLCSSV
jgi:hypothetical protein